MFYNLNENTEKIISLQGRDYFVPYALPKLVKDMVQAIDSNRPLLEQWSAIAVELLSPMNDSLPELNKEGVSELISIIEKY